MTTKATDFGLRTTGVALCALLALARPAAADLVHLTNGRTLSVESWSLDGPTIILVFRDGGRMEAPASLVSEVLPDEYPRVRAAEPAVASAGDGLDGSSALQPLVDRVATRYGIDVKLARAVVRV